MNYLTIDKRMKEASIKVFFRLAEVTLTDKRMNKRAGRHITLHDHARGSYRLPPSDMLGRYHLLEKNERPIITLECFGELIPDVWLE